MNEYPHSHFNIGTIKGGMIEDVITFNMSKWMEKVGFKLKWVLLKVLRKDILPMSDIWMIKDRSSEFRWMAKAESKLKWIMLLAIHTLVDTFKSNN
jgi:hypothetical protein